MPRDEPELVRRPGNPTDIGATRASGAGQDSRPYPAQNGQPYPAQNGQPYPAQNRDRYPAQNRDPYPAQNRQPYPAQNGQPYPAQNGQPYPAQNRDRYPAQNRDRYPAQNRNRYPAQNGQPYPAQNGQPYPAQNRDRYPRRNWPPYPPRNRPPYPPRNRPLYPPQNRQPSPPQYFVSPTYSAADWRALARAAPTPNDTARWPTILCGGLIVIANILAVTGFQLRFIGPAIGFWFILVYPAYLCYTSSAFRKSSAAERAGYSVGAVLLFLMLAGLAVNTLLPEIGVERPLDAVPVAIIGDVLNVLAFWLRWRFPSGFRWREQLGSVGIREGRLIVGSALSVPLAVMGANLLNNGAGDQGALAALGCVLVTVILLLFWRRWLREGVISVVLYLLSLSLLLMTSLRGWSISGNDIQDEYVVFQYTADHGRWVMSNFPHDTYNACLSLTILPTEFARVLNIYNPDVFKLFFQILFALCPVLVYAIARRHWSRIVSILATIYFVGFPTYLTDMSYVNRQEIGFLFAAIGVLAITNYWWSLRQRRLALIIAAVGIELSHYSTMYIFLGFLLMGWAIPRLSAAISRFVRRRGRLAQHSGRAGYARPGLASFTLNGACVAAAAAVLLVWGGLITQTAGTALSAIESSIPGRSGAQSTGVLYGIFHLSVPPPQDLLAQYRQQGLRQDEQDGSLFVSASLEKRYATPYVTEPAMPLTELGRSLGRVGVSAASLNTAVRQGAAKDEQLFLVLGLIAILGTLRLRRRLGAEFLALIIGSLVMLGFITILPGLSTEYGVERVFLEALIVLAPVLVEGSRTVFSLFGETWKTRAAAIVCVTVFFSTIGLMPQLLGGYQAQLSLNNSGQYYDDYYVHPQELAAVSWLAGKPEVLPANLQATMDPDRFKFTAASDINASQFVNEAFPTQVETNSWLLLDYAVIYSDRATIDIQSDLINYKYPVGLIDRTKNLVYNNGDDEIFK